MTENMSGGDMGREVVPFDVFEKGNTKYFSHFSRGEGGRVVVAAERRVEVGQR